MERRDYLLWIPILHYGKERLQTVAPILYYGEKKLLAMGLPFSTLERRDY